MIKTKMSYKLKKNKLKVLEKAFKDLANSSVDVGIFDNTPHYSGLGYATLLALHHEGFITSTGGEVPARPVLTLAGYDLFDFEVKGKLTKILKNELSKKPTTTFVSNINEGFGSILLNIAKSDVIGSPIYLEPVTQYTLDRRIENKQNEPLVDTGDLRDKFEFRVNT